MRKLKYSLLICFSIIHLSYAKSSILDKIVILPTGQISLKLTLKSLSNQTGCVFSYNPTKISENTILTFSTKNTLTLNNALKQILPKTIQFKVNGKYIVLQKQELESKNKIFSVSEKQKALKNPIPKFESLIDKDPKIVRLVIPSVVSDNNNSVINQKDSMVYITPSNANDVVELKLDSVLADKTSSDSVEIKNKSIVTKNDTILASSFSQFIKKNAILVIELSSNTPLTSLSLQTGLYGIYSIISIASDYNKSYRFGIGAGANVKINNHFGINLNFVRHSLVAGKSYELGVRGALIHFDPVIHYSIRNEFNFFIGPSFYMSESSYVDPITTTDLGNSYGVGAIIGLKVDIISFFTNNKQAKTTKI
jgi:hypothetical protein